MRFSIYVAAAFGVLGLVGCDGDPTVEPPPKEICQGHLCGKGLLPDGGEIRFENFMYPNGTQAALGEAFFYKDQVPEKMVFPTLGACNDLRTNQLFPWGSDAPSGNSANFVVERTYLDAGANVTALAPNGKTIVLPKRMDGIDYNQRHHAIYYLDQREDFPNVMSLDIDVVGGTGDQTYTELEIAIDGGPDFPNTTYIGGLGKDNPGIVIPNRITFNVPLSTLANTNPACDPMNPMVPPPPNCCDATMGACPGPAFLPIKIGEDLPLTWDAAAAVDATQPDVQQAFVSFGDFAFNVLMNCPVEANRGQFTISKEDLATLPDQGIILVGYATHQYNEIDGRRIDMIGTSCRSAIYVKVP